MNLILEIVNTPPYSTFEKNITFNQTGGKIGRNKLMDWVLNDPNKRISNFHAEITFSSGQYFITDKSSNGTYFKNPQKKLTKGIVIPLSQTNFLIIGDYEISIKLVNNEFIGKSNTNSIISEEKAIPDAFFTGNSTKKAFDVINKKDKGSDILSLIDNDYSPESNQILPEFENIIDSFDIPQQTHQDNTLNIHMETPTERSIEPILGQENDSKLFQILSMKLGIDSSKMTFEEKKIFISQIAELAKTTIEQVQASEQALKSIKSQLGTSHDEITPFSHHQTNEVFTLSHTYSQPLSIYVKKIFHSLNTHNVALFTASKNISIQMGETFSPQKLYFSFEQENKLSKKLVNKKALAWDAYSEKFNYLNNIKKTDEVDMDTLKKEYESILKTLNLGR